MPITTPRHRLEDLIDDLVIAVLDEDHPDEMGIWAVASLAHRLGLEVEVWPADEPVRPAERPSRPTRQ